MQKTNNMGTNLPIDFKSFNSPEHESWKAHRQLLSHLKDSDAGYRGCFGIALLINSVNADSWLQLPRTESTTDNPFVFVPDSTVSWATLVDVPLGYFRFNDQYSREVHWATVRNTTTKFGMPTLARGSEDKMAFDFRAFPFGKAKVRSPDGKAWHVVTPGADSLNTEHYPQLFRVFNALEWAMTTTAFSFRSSWAHARPAMFQALGYEYEPDKKLLAFGHGMYDGAARPNQWMPRAYLAFPENMRDRLFERSTRPAGTLVPDAEPVYTEGIKEAFMDAMGVAFEFRAHFAGRVASMERMYYHGVPVVSVLLKGDQGERQVVRFFRDTAILRKRVRDTFKPGEVIGEEKLDGAVPDDWFNIPYFKRWDRYAAGILHPRRLDAVMRLWFERQAVNLQPGYVHFPAQIASVAALGAAVDDRLFWEVSDSLEYYRDDADAIIFPTVQLRGWYDLAGCLPGDVAYDLNPADPRYESYLEQKQRLAGAKWATGEAKKGKKAAKTESKPKKPRKLPPHVLAKIEEAGKLLLELNEVRKARQEARSVLIQAEKEAAEKEAAAKAHKQAKKKLAKLNRETRLREAAQAERIATAELRQKEIETRLDALRADVEAAVPEAASEAVPEAAPPAPAPDEDDNYTGRAYARSAFWRRIETVVFSAMDKTAALVAGSKKV